MAQEMSLTSPGPTFPLPRHFLTLRAVACRRGVGSVSFGGGLPPPFADTCRCSKLHLSSTLRAVACRSGGGCCGAQRRCRCPSPLLASLSFHPQPTPQAVAREAGGEWCGVVHHPPPSLVLPVVAAIHPPSTPRAVAHGAGGGWCVVRCVVLVLVLGLLG
jgi:hypothetical protein